MSRSRNHSPASRATNHDTIGAVALRIANGEFGEDRIVADVLNLEILLAAMVFPQRDLPFFERHAFGPLGAIKLRRRGSGFLFLFQRLAGHIDTTFGINCRNRLAGFAASQLFYFG